MSTNTNVTSVPTTAVASTSNTTSLIDTIPSTIMTTDVDSEISAVTHVRLPGFWQHSPLQWFTHADAMFANKRIRSDLTRVNHVLEALDEDGVRTVSDLLGPDASYDRVRQRLVTAYSLPPATQLQRIIQPGGMGDRTPSRLLRDMREVYPDGMSETSLVAFWMSKLPPPIRTVVAVLSGSGDYLAERADRVWEAYQTAELSAVDTDADRREASTIPPRPGPAIAPEDTRYTSMENAIHALTAQVAALATSHATALAYANNDRAPQQQRDRSRSRSQPQPRSTPTARGWCYYHDRYGADARKCRDPCTFASATRKNP
ncbi:uncharacterized protein LOC126552516 [Aphis gossypii]|uniref:uncharacterized protein LOC126552516 n=1 Tax=Aphis gossypii TaxID=80765 RepID=UPI002158D857|nr:uncharacterized protein LOC126552516 [Aphis gossypii]